MSERERFRNSVAPFMPGRGRAVPIRSKLSGKVGLAYPDDPHVWVEGQGVAGWYRRETLDRDFIKESD
jgi:hypothetical protein